MQTLRLEATCNTHHLAVQPSCDRRKNNHSSYLGPQLNNDVRERTSTSRHGGLSGAAPAIARQMRILLTIRHITVEDWAAPHGCRIILSRTP